MKREREAWNQGIIGNVTANAVAVGTGATAIGMTGPADGGALNKAVAELHGAIEALGLKPAAKEALAGDLEELRKASASAAPDRDHIGGILKTVAGKLKMVGVIITETAALAEPARKIADALRTTLTSLGIG